MHLIQIQQGLSAIRDTHSIAKSKSDNYDKSLNSRWGNEAVKEIHNSIPTGRCTND